MLYSRLNCPWVLVGPNGIPKGFDIWKGSDYSQVAHHITGCHFILTLFSGGKSQEDKETGIRSLRVDQTTDDTSVKALLNNLENFFPVAFIIGKFCFIL